MRLRCRQSFVRTRPGARFGGCAPLRLFKRLGFRLQPRFLERRRLRGFQFVGEYLFACLDLCPAAPFSDFAKFHFPLRRYPPSTRHLFEAHPYCRH